MKFKLYAGIVMAGMFFSYSASAQNKVKMPVSTPEMEKASAEYAQKFEEYKAAKKNNSSARTAASTNKKIIPVVFHVIHQWGAQNVGKSTLKNFLSEMNKDYSRSNTDTAVGASGAAYAAFRNDVANTNVEFRLATIDPKGNKTDGIDRVVSYKTHGVVRDLDPAQDTAVKNLSYWDSKKYLNIWLVDSIGTVPPSSNDPNMHELAAFAQPAQLRNILGYSDGIMLSYSVVISKGPSIREAVRTLTMETAYWLGLQSLTGANDYTVASDCKDDGIKDTPAMLDSMTFNTCGPFPFTDPRDKKHGRYCLTYFDSAVCLRDSVMYNKDSTESRTICAKSCRTVLDDQGNEQYICSYTTNITQTVNSNIVSKKTRKNPLNPPLDSVQLIYGGIEPEMIHDLAGVNESIARDTANGFMFNNFLSPIQDKGYRRYHYPWTGLSGSGSCRNMFTKGQKEYIDFALDSVNGIRNVVATKSNAIATGTDGDDATYAAAQNLGGIPKPYYLITDPNIKTPLLNVAPYVNNKHYVCANSTITFTDTSWNGSVVNRKWRFDGGIASSYTDRVVTVTYPTAGAYDVCLTVGNSNGQDSMLNRGSIVVVDNAYFRANYVEDFESPYFTDNGWQGINYQSNDNDRIKWERVEGVGYNSNSSVVLKNYVNSANTSLNTYDLVTPPIQILPGATGDKNVYISYYYSYAQTTPNTIDGLKIYSSTDCGDTWALIGSRAPNKLSTSGIVTGYFTPSSPLFWKRDSIKITAAGNHVLIKFRFVATGGDNNLYFDKIGITAGALGVEDLMSRNLELDIFPNPAANETKVSFNLDKDAKTRISVMDITGREIGVIADARLNVGAQQFTIRNTFGAGIYFLKLQVGDYETVRKVVFEN